MLCSECKDARMSKIANGDMRQRVKKTFIDCRPDHSEVE